MITLAVTLLALVTLGCVTGSLVSAHRKGTLSLARVGLTILLTVAVLLFVAVLIWVFFISQIHVG